MSLSPLPNKWGILVPCRGKSVCASCRGRKKIFPPKWQTLLCRQIVSQCPNVCLINKFCLTCHCIRLSLFNHLTNERQTKLLRYRNVKSTRPHTMIWWGTFVEMGEGGECWRSNITRLFSVCFFGKEICLWVKPKFYWICLSESMATCGWWLSRNWEKEFFIRGAK